MRTHIFTGSFRPIIHITYVHHFFCLLERRGVLKASIQGACRGVVFGGGITPDLTVPSVTPDLRIPYCPEKCKNRWDGMKILARLAREKVTAPGTVC